MCCRGPGCLPHACRGVSSQVRLLAVEVPAVLLQCPVAVALEPLAAAVFGAQLRRQLVLTDDLPVQGVHSRVGNPPGAVHSPVHPPDLLLEALGALSQLHQANRLIGAVGQGLGPDVQSHAALAHGVEQFAGLRLGLDGRWALQHQLDEVPPALWVCLTGDPAVAHPVAEGLFLVAIGILAAALDLDADFAASLSKRHGHGRMVKHNVGGVGLALDGKELSGLGMGDPLALAKEAALADGCRTSRWPYS